MQLMSENIIFGSHLSILVYYKVCLSTFSQGVICNTVVKMVINGVLNKSVPWYYHVFWTCAMAFLNVNTIVHGFKYHSIF